MKIHVLPIAVAAILILHPARVSAQAAINWGQNPKPELVGKVQQAVATSQTNAPAAEKLLREVVGADPDYYRAQLNLGLVLLQQGRNKDAAAELTTAFKIQGRLKIENPAIYAEYGYALSKADETEKAAGIFMEGAGHVSELSDEEQKKLLLRGISSFLDFQDPPGGRKFVQTAIQAAKGKITPETQMEAQKFLDEGVARITRNDVQEGWVRLTKPKEASSPNAPEESFFKKVNGEAGVPKAGDIVTPASVVVNMRADKQRPENIEATLGKWVGFARVEEQFEVLEVAPVRTGDTTAIWMRVKRHKP